MLTPEQRAVAMKKAATLLVGIEEAEQGVRVMKDEHDRLLLLLAMDGVEEKTK